MDNVYTGWEFKIIQGAYSEVQKWLNQWKHTYKLQFHKVSFWRDSHGIEGSTILLSRKGIIK